jgi:hypothetical protein
MACNCKKANELQDKYGIPQEESLLKKTYIILFKIFVMLLGLVLGIVVVPIVICALIYNQIFRAGKPLKLPRWLSKFLK